MNILTKISLGIAVVAVIGFLWQTVRVQRQKTTIQALELSQSSLEIALEQKEQTTKALQVQIQNLYTAQEKYIADIERNRKVFKKTQLVEVDKTKVVDDETRNNAIDIINQPLPSGL